MSELSPAQKNEKDARIYRYAEDALQRGQSHSEIAKELLAREELPLDAGYMVIEKLYAARIAAQRRAAIQPMVIGAGAFLIGLLITIATYNYASKFGGISIVTSGVVIWGGTQFIKGLNAYLE
jgi:hypothetical protein